MSSSWVESVRGTRLSNRPPKSSKEPEINFAEVKYRVAVRYLVKRSKKFGYGPRKIRISTKGLRTKVDTPERREVQVERKMERPPEQLLYLGLYPRRKEEEPRRSRKKEEHDKDDFEFCKPQIFECNICYKIFFHKLVYRGHMIKHIRNDSVKCPNCDKTFLSGFAKRKHVASCQG